MKASELITALEAAIKEHGDLDVVTIDVEYCQAQDITAAAVPSKEDWFRDLARNWIVIGPP